MAGNGKSRAENLDMVEVLIVGAGPTGLTAAIDLARRKIPFRIIDKAPRPVRESRAAGVWPRTVEVLDKLGVSEELIAHGKVTPELQGFTLNGSKPFFRMSLRDVDTPYPFVLVLPQNETEEILSERLKALGQPIERSVELLDLRQDADGARATISRGARGREVVRARWVLGCDGAHSLVRKAVGLEFPGAPYVPSFVLADVDVEWKFPPDCGRVFLEPDGPVAFLPFRENKRYRVIAQMPEVSAAQAGAHGVPEEMGLDDFETMLQGRLPPGVRLSNPQWIARFNIHHRRVDKFRVGRVFVIGDAAHIHSPVGGQGMNTGIQDALNLTWKLAHVIQEAASPEILDTYQSERLPVAAALLRGTDVATRIFTTHSRPLQMLRNHLLMHVSQVNWLRHNLAEAASEITIRYRGNQLVGYSKKNTLVGLRAPDGELRFGQTRARLYSRLRDCEHAFLAFSGPADRKRGEPLQNLAEEVRRRFGAWAEVIAIASNAEEEKASGVTVGVDATGELHRKYGVKGSAVLWIRPDGFVGYRSEPVELDALEAFLSTSFDLKKMPRKEVGAPRAKAAKTTRPRARAAK